MKDLLFAIDNGTQSVKALVFDVDGNMIAKEKIDFEPYFSENPGWAEQHAEVFYDSMCLACRGIWDKHGVDPARIAGVSVTTQRGTVINMDADGKPMRPAMLWLDQRKSYDLGPLPQPWNALFTVARVKETIEFLRREAEAVWIYENQRDLWNATHKYLLLSGYLNFCLTGEYVDSVGCQVGYIPFDYNKQTWFPGWDWRWNVLRVRQETLPRLVEPGKPMGSVTKKAAEATGLPEGLPVIAAAADKACEVLGSGARNLDTGCISYGTTATINVNSKKHASAIPLMPAYPSGIAGEYNMEVQIFRGFWMVSWFKQEFGFEETKKAQEDGLVAEQVLEKLVADIPPGSLGLMLQPYWTPGPRHPGPEGKGTIIGFGDAHNKAHFYKSIFEGLAYALREGRERIEKKTKVPINRLIVSGGGSQSNAAMQITADVFGLPASRPHLYETSGLGAAMDLAVGLGLHKDFTEAVARMTRPGDTFTPDPAAHKIYTELYKDVYLKLYDKLRPLYKRIRDITGYPR